MHYLRMEKGIFHSRPNRFIAEVEVDGKEQRVHVKNTGRCRELLIPGTEVYLQRSENPDRKTAYDLITVRKGDQLVNMDSQAPNKVAEELLRAGRLVGPVTYVRPETTYGNSRFDLYAEAGEEKWFIEVKGVTLEIDGGAYFPDAPTERGIKHMQELMACMDQGYHAMLVFIIQMKGVSFLKANALTHPEFAKVMKDASCHGVQLRAFDCIVTEDELTADGEIPVIV